jgi:hypothetical protein
MTSRARSYTLYGLNVRSEVVLPGAETTSDGSPDLEVSWGKKRAVPATAPDGEVLATFRWEAGRGYTLARSAAGYTLRIHSLCDFAIAGDHRSISVHLDDDADPELASLLLAGNVLSVVLGLRGECVLHASAVEIGGEALACLGGSGAGKSTLAALLCAAGADLVTDDVLRLDLSGERIRCFTGPLEARLRPGAASLTEGLGRSDAKPTADERLAIKLRSAPGSKPELRAVVIPRPSREIADLKLAKHTRHGALLELVRYPRIVGWQTEKPLRSQFRGFSRIATTVPVFSAEIPWGPPFQPEIAERLLRSTGFRAPGEGPR